MSRLMLASSTFLQLQSLFSANSWRSLIVHAYYARLKELNRDEYLECLRGKQSQRNGDPSDTVLHKCPSSLNHRATVGWSLATL